jgi:hypothetical protein
MKLLNRFLGTFSVVASVGFIPTVAAAADHPFMVQSPLNASSPLMLALPAKTEDGKTATTAVIKFISVECDSAPGIQSLGVARITAIFNGDAGFFALPFMAPQSFVNQTEFVIAQATLIYANAGTSLTFGLSADVAPCSVVLTGNLLTKDK